VVTFYLYFTFTVKKQFKDGFLKKGNALVQTIAYNLGPGIYFNDSKFIQNILKGLENDPDVSFVLIKNAEDEHKYSEGLLKDKQQLEAFLISGKIQIYCEDYLFVKQSIFFRDIYQGEIVVAFDLNWISTNMQKQMQNLIFLSGVLAIVLFLLASFLANSISKPLKEAADIIKGYSDKDVALDMRLPVKGDDEIAQLARALNHLADNLDSNILELNRSKKYLETIFQLNPIPIVIADTLGEIEEANETACSFFGMDHDLLVQMKLENFIQKEDLDTIFNRIIEEMQSIRSYVTTLKMTDGPKKVVELNVASYIDESNLIKNVIIAAIDITEKIQIQRENISQHMMRSINSKEILKTLIESSSLLMEASECFIYLHDKTNNTLKLHLTYPRESSNRLTNEIADQNNFIWRTYKDNQAQLLESRKFSPQENKILGLNAREAFSLVALPISEKDYYFGVIIFLRSMKQPFRVEEIHLLSTLATQTAILLDNKNLVKALEEKAFSLESAYSELQRSQQQVIQLQKMESLGTLVGGIAHDFNNILGIILPNTDLIKNEIDGNPAVLRRINTIADATQRAADLTRQLLMFSRNQDIQLQIISPNTLVNRLSEMFKRTLGKEYDIVLDLDPKVEEIEGDENRLTQVLINLALNARDSMLDGGEIIIRTQMRKFRENSNSKGIEKNYVCVSMTDAGSGIKSSDLDKIFDPFFTTKSVGKGTGLGLSVVYGIMQSHQGFVDVKSEEGKGTTVYLYFPPSTKKEILDIDGNGKKKLEGSEKILIVDDEKLIRESVKDILESLGYVVMQAESGTEALKLIEKDRKKPHLAIVDMSMPKMNGVETIRRIRELDKKMKILLSSGHLEKDNMIPDDINLDGILPKPYRLRELALKIRQVLSQ
jgi:PAS domain S-box-containing protein